MTAAKRRIDAATKNASDVDFAPPAQIESAEIQNPKSKIQNALIELPIGEFSEGQRRPSHIEARISPKQGRALQRLLNGLNAKYGAGWRRRDFGYADVLRWLLDQLPD